MATYPCPKCHSASSDPDWCSECGAAMNPTAQAPLAAPPGAAAATSPAAAAMLCPDCGTPRERDAEWCGVCRYNFLTGRSYSPQPPASVANPPATPATPATPAAPAMPQDGAAPVAAPAALGQPLLKWSITIAFDPTIDPTLDPAALKPRPDRSFPLDLPEMKIGRAGSKAHPEIPIDDEGVSSRHALLTFSPEGSLSITDLNSTNGTIVNDQALTAGVAHRLTAGDTIKIGRWSKLTIVG